jgi:predicted nucleic acid-binding Zn ribbon protein
MSGSAKSTVLDIDPLRHAAHEAREPVRRLHELLQRNASAAEIAAAARAAHWAVSHLWTTAEAAASKARRARKH